MELKDYINSELDRAKQVSTKALDTLTQQEIMWRPASGCNSMGLILFHAARSEDSFVQSTLQGKPRIWETGKWYNKLKMAESETGSHYSIDQVNLFPVPDIKNLLAYYDEVRANTVDYLNNLPPNEFERQVMRRSSESTVAEIFSIIVSHAAQHMGEISYLRGMLRGLDR
ncbi:DinB family protein [Chloroflexota bacterium]